MQVVFEIALNIVRVRRLQTFVFRIPSDIMESMLDWNLTCRADVLVR